MSNSERIREAVDGALDAQYVKAREAAGWRLVSVEWERAGEAGSAGQGVGGGRADDGSRDRATPETPIGWRAVPEGSRLEEDADEMQFLFAVMELMIQDISITKVAEELNQRGFRTRAGNAWGPVAVFNLLPRLVELTPRIFRSEEWVERRKNLTPVF
jgi:hypothetical protein